MQKVSAVLLDELPQKAFGNVILLAVDDKFAAGVTLEFWDRMGRQIKIEKKVKMYFSI